MIRRLLIALFALPVAIPVHAQGTSQPAEAAEIPYAYVDLPRIVRESVMGQAASRALVAVQDERLQEVEARQKAMQASRSRLEAGANVMSTQAIGRAQRDIERQQIDLQRFVQDAENELQALEAERLAEIQQRLQPILQQIFLERGLLMLFDVAAAPFILADPAIDLTGDVLERLDQSTTAVRPADS